MIPIKDNYKQTLSFVIYVIIWILINAINIC